MTGVDLDECLHKELGQCRHRTELNDSRVRQPIVPALLSSKPRTVMQDDQMQRDLLANFCARALDEDIAASPVADMRAGRGNSADLAMTATP
ncbi:hypothetical protein [Mycobacterium sp.]|uniref:hypothetical protein n=1 Tax=Mycobacterium sp. TaxID=1785 RepID=UPI0028BE8C6A|nr:hypothetical protein [Mycobacterium sp.]